MPPPDDLTLNHHTSTEAAQLMDELCDAYADVYGAVRGEDTREKSSAFRDRATGALQADYSLVTARVGGQLVGFAFGLQLAAGAGVVGWPSAGAAGGLHGRDRIAHGRSG